MLSLSFERWQDSVGRERYRPTDCGVDHRGDAGTASRPTGVQLRPWVSRQPREPGVRARRNARPQCANAQGSAFSGRARARGSASIRRRPGASTRRSMSAINNLEHRGLDVGCAPTAPMGWHTPLHCRYWPERTCTASVCLCDGACVMRAERRRRRRAAWSAAIACGLRPRNTSPAHGDGNGLRCPEVENVDRFDAKRRSVPHAGAQWVAWPKPRRMCGGSSQIPRESGGFLAVTR